MQAVRTLIVDDDAKFRQRVGELLSSEAGITIVGEAADGPEAVSKARTLRPDLILMDIRMAGMSGLEAARQIKVEMPGMWIVILTLYELEEYKEAARTSGINGYVVKRSLLDDLIPTIKSLI